MIQAQSRNIKYMSGKLLNWKLYWISYWSTSLFSQHEYFLLSLFFLRYCFVHVIAGFTYLVEKLICKYLWCSTFGKLWLISWSHWVAQYRANLKLKHCNFWIQNVYGSYCLNEFSGTYFVLFEKEVGIMNINIFLRNGKNTFLTK